MTHIIKKRIKFMDLKSTINEMNNSLEVLKARFELTKKKKSVKMKRVQLR